MKFFSGNQLFWWCVSIALIVVAFFWPAIFHDFVNWDDVVYVLENERIKLPFSQIFQDVFTRFFQGHYHPFALLSLALDFKFFGLNASAFILHNIALHTATACMLFVFLSRQLENRGIAFFVTLFFAIHPLRIESVVWVSERKDVLFLFWFVAALISYQSFSFQGTKKWLRVSLGCFLLALFAKSTSLLLPFYLIMVGSKKAKTTFNSVLALWPFWLLSLLFGAIAITAVSSGKVSDFDLPTFNRLYTSIVALGWYWGAIVLPINLSVLYPFHFSVLVLVSAAIGILMIVGIVLFSYSKRQSDFRNLVGLGLITIAPFLPFSGVLLSPYNDRYSYLFAISFSWLLGSVLVYVKADKLKFYRHTAVILLLGMGALLWHNMHVWQNSQSLWTNTLTVDSENYFAYLNRAQFFASKGKIEQAKEDLIQANRLQPNAIVVIDNLYTIAIQSRQVDEVVNWGSKLFNKKPTADLANEIALLCYSVQKFDWSRVFYEKSLTINPNQPDVEINLALIAFQGGALDSTEKHLKKALSIQPEHMPTLEKLATFYYQQGKLVEACELLQKAVGLGSAKAAQMAEQVCS